MKTSDTIKKKKKVIVTNFLIQAKQFLNAVSESWNKTNP